VKLGVLVAVLVLAWAATAVAADGPRTRVSPNEGGAQRTFIVGFTAPVQTTKEISYTVVANRRVSDGCTWSASAGVMSAAAGERVRVRLRPESAGWCRGPFSGKVQVLDAPYCPPQADHCSLRPAFYRTIGRFHFRVR